MWIEIEKFLVFLLLGVRRSTRQRKLIYDNFNTSWILGTQTLRGYPMFLSDKVPVRSCVDKGLRQEVVEPEEPGEEQDDEKEVHKKRRTISDLQTNVIDDDVIYFANILTQSYVCADGSEEEPTETQSSRSSTDDESGAEGPTGKYHLRKTKPTVERFQATIETNFKFLVFLLLGVRRSTRQRKLIYDNFNTSWILGTQTLRGYPMFLSDKVPVRSCVDKGLRQEVVEPEEPGEEQDDEKEVHKKRRTISDLQTNVIDDVNGSEEEPTETQSSRSSTDDESGAEGPTGKYHLRKTKPTVERFQATIGLHLKKCLPLNFNAGSSIPGSSNHGRSAGDHKQIVSTLADVDPMSLDRSIRFSHVGGLESHIRCLKEMIVFPMMYREVFEKFHIQPPKGVLFHGPPGTGKTLIARALANECSQGDRQVSFFMRKGADCLSKWVGESERQLRLLFEQERQEILRIHVSQWEKPPSTPLLNQLAEQAVGYCGSDLRALCSEAVIQGLRRRYPQIYKSSQKLLLDPNDVKVEKIDFVRAKCQIVPASHRVTPGAGRKLSVFIEPLLKKPLDSAISSLKESFPQGMSRTLASNSKAVVGFTRSVHRPRLLLVGSSGKQAQTSHLGPALLHHMEHVTVHTLDLTSMYEVSGRSPEEACIQIFQEARRNLPSIIYVPSISEWWKLVPETLHAVFLSHLCKLDPYAPVLLLATSDIPYNVLPHEIQSLFSEYRGEVLVVQDPSMSDREAFFKPLFLTEAARPPKMPRKTADRFEELPLAPPPAPVKLSEAELKKVYENEEATLRELRIFLREICAKLARNRQFFMFTKPVDVQEVPDYLSIIKQPMDLETMMTKIDLHRYVCAQDFLDDVDLLCRNALEYNPDRDPADKLIRHRACSLRDTAYTLIKAEMDSDFEEQCKEISRSRRARAESPSRFAPDFVHTKPLNSQIVQVEVVALPNEPETKIVSPTSVATNNTGGPVLTLSRIFQEARRNLPSIIYVPSISEWWKLVPETLHAVFLSHLCKLDPYAPVLLLATSDIPYNVLPHEIQSLFSEYRGEVLVVQDPSMSDREAFFKPLFLTEAARPPKMPRKTADRFEELPLAPPPAPVKLSEAELKKVYENEEATLRELRIFLREICAKLARNRQFFMFTKPVDVQEVPDYLSIIKQPMDLETMMTKIDLHRYVCAQDFLDDVDLL
ncbi:hypothetical protein C0J52_13738 [Blattella germanica]|nr:hypothetical protein C0J52_13738 [Blattella germanica]